MSEYTDPIFEGIQTEKAMQGTCLDCNKKLADPENDKVSRIREYVRKKIETHRHKALSALNVDLDELSNIHNDIKITLIRVADFIDSLEDEK